MFFGACTSLFKKKKIIGVQNHLACRRLWPAQSGGQLKQDISCAMIALCIHACVRMLILLPAWLDQLGFGDFD